MADDKPTQDFIELLQDTRIEKPALPSALPDLMIATKIYDDNNTSENRHSLISYLGYNSDVFYYYLREAGRTFALTASEHTELNFLGMMSTRLWNAEYPECSDPETKKINWRKVAEYMMENCRAIGAFDSDRIRGRGGWIDGNNIVFNLGDGWIVGEPDKFFYVNKAAVLENPEPATKDEMQGLLRLCRCLSWKNKVSGYFLAGWMATATICGILPWRSHLWIIGPAGTGKTYLCQKIVKAVLGKNALNFQGATTAAGIRQKLDGDAMPVIFDEAESETKRAAENIQNILALARQSSSDSAGEIVKGTSSGKHMPYRMRSSFLMASIASGTVQGSDITRFTELELCVPGEGMAFEDLEQVRLEVIKGDYAERFFARQITYAPIIRDNCNFFINAAASHKNSRRFGDQIGVILAGCHSLEHGTAIRYQKEADDYAAPLLAMMVYEGEDRTDSERLRDHILQSPITYEKTGNRYALTVGRMIETKNTGEVLTAAEADEALSEHGMKYEGGYLFVANSHRALSVMLRDSAWSVNYGSVLKRLKGADNNGNLPIRFSGVLSKVTRLPVA